MPGPEIVSGGMGRPEDYAKVDLDQVDGGVEARQERRKPGGQPIKERVERR
jgi:hypothetical protein